MQNAIATVCLSGGLSEKLAAIAAAGAASVARRDLVRRAMEHNGTSWDYQPFVDARQQYVR